MKRSLILLAIAAVSTLAITNQTEAQQKRRNNGGSKVQVQFKFNGGGNHRNHQHRNWNHQNKNQHWNKHQKQGHWQQKGHWQQQHHHGQKVHFHNHKINYVTFYQFPYKVCWNQGQYWVLYGNQWIPYGYMVQHHAGCNNWHRQYFHKQNHKFKHNFK